MSRMLKLLLLLFLSANFSFSDSKIDKNKDRISQIDKQVKQNEKKIKKNTSKISSAQRDENKVKREIRVLNDRIYRLQKEYNNLERQYKTLNIRIKRNEKEIVNSINKIKQSTNTIDFSEEQYANRVKVLDKIRRARLVKNIDGRETAIQTKRRNDAKKILDLQEINIHGVKYYKKTVEENKKNVEKIKQDNLNEASKIRRARRQLNVKKKELNKAKIDKDRKVEELRRIRSRLGRENKKIISSNTKLMNEKKRLEQEIQRIIKDATKKKKTSPSTKFVKGTGRLQMPIKGTIVTSFNQEKVKGVRSNGIEIKARYGQNVSAADTGTVIHTGNMGSMGGIVIISHGNLVTVYGHLDNIKVKKGENVVKGQSIGTLGNNPNSNNTILYFETRDGVNPVDPRKFM